MRPTQTTCALKGCDREADAQPSQQREPTVAGSASPLLSGLEYGPPIDMWSLGCVLAELHTGSPLFPGDDEKQQMSHIAAVLGPPPTALATLAPRASVFFDGALAAALWWGYRRGSLSKAMVAPRLPASEPAHD